MNIFLAKQPIFDKYNNIFGYELLFRNNDNNYFPKVNKDFATSSVISNIFMNLSLSDVVRDNYAAINVTKKMLETEALTIFTDDKLIIDISQNIKPTQSIYEAIKHLKNINHLISIDHCYFKKEWEKYPELIDIININFNKNPGYINLKFYKNKNIKLLAKKIEDYNKFSFAKGIGFNYFQGYYFAKPKVLKNTKIPENKMNKIRILKEMQKNRANINKIASIVKQDPALTYKLLKFINSAYFGIRNQINSIKHAINMLGFIEFKKWIYIVFLGSMNQEHPNELIQQSLIRAKFCENISKNYFKRNDDIYFLTGMLSLIDTILERPKEKILNEIDISSEVKNALLSKTNQLGNIIELVELYETLNHKKLNQLIDKLKINTNLINKYYLNSLKWSNKIINNFK